MGRITVGFFLASALAPAQSWMQWGMNAQHTGAVNVAAQPAARLLAEVVHDPFSRLIQEESGGSLLAHYQPPLTDGRDVYVAVKGGQYVPCIPPGSGGPDPCGADAWSLQSWGVRNLRWVNGRLRERWLFESDWKPLPDAGGLFGWEPVFHAALGERFLAVPAAGGEVWIVRRPDGRPVRRIQPFGDAIDPNKHVAGPISIGPDGSLYYNVLEVDPRDPWGRERDIPGAWLVKVSRNGETRLADYRKLIPDAPATCKGTFSAAELPWPPSPSAVPPGGPCFSQRPGVNVAPAIAPDGTIYTVSRGHHSLGARYSYLIALRPDLTLQWAASLRDRLRDGCGGILPVGAPGGCRAGTPASGVDPATNELPAGQVTDLSTSSPVVAPDGSILYGAQTRYNYLRGHLMRFSAAGAYLNAYDFGWDTTPAVWEHDGTYSIVLKENGYPVGSYCGDFRWCPPRPNGPYAITQLSPSMQVEWKFENSNPQACERKADGSVECVPAVPGGFEWCINAPAVDVLGNVFANSEDGNLYVIAQGGREVRRFFLNLAVGAAYTPLSIGYDGKIYTMNDGKVFVVGR